MDRENEASEPQDTPAALERELRERFRGVRLIFEAIDLAC
jgi:hypothetical protein